MLHERRPFSLPARGGFEIQGDTRPSGTPSTAPAFPCAQAAADGRKTARHDVLQVARVRRLMSRRGEPLPRSCELPRPRWLSSTALAADAQSQTIASLQCLRVELQKEERLLHCHPGQAEP